MDNNVTQQLVTEIKKLKDKDYTSYQNFYSQTSQYLYGVIWENVQDQETANLIMNELYSDIYANIGTELTNDSEFYTWAKSKAEAISNDYVATRVITKADEDKNLAKSAGVAAAANIPFDLSSGSGAGVVDGAGNVGMGQATGGNMSAGMGQASGGNMQAGAINRGAGNVQTGSISKTPGNVQTGSINAETGVASNQPAASHPAGGQSTASQPTGGQSAGSASAGNGSAGVSSAVAKTGMSVGAKIALAVGGAAVVAGLAIGIVALVKPKDKNKDASTELTTEVAVVSTEATTEELTTEVVAVDNTERYAAYWDLAAADIQAYSTVVSYSSWDKPSGFIYADLVDFNHTGKEQYISVHTRDDVDEWGYSRPVAELTIYDYTDDGSLVTVAEFDECNSVYYTEENGQTLIWIEFGNGYSFDLPENENNSILGFKYDNGALTQVHNYTYQEEYDDMFNMTYSYYEIDGNPISDRETFFAQYREVANGTGEYAFGYGSGSGSDIDDESRCLVAKHVAIAKLAQAAGNAEFADTNNTATIVEESEDGRNFTYTVVNKYNEVYTLNASGMYGKLPEISNDGNSVRVHEWGNGMSLDETTMCFTYVNDVLMVSGVKDYNGYYYYDLDNYFLGRNENNISYSEFKDKINELMTR